MVTAGNDMGQWLRPVLTRDEHADRAARGEVFERAGCVVQPGRKLSQVVQRRPPGITAHQWSSAIRAELDFVVCAAAGYAPTFAVVLTDPAGRSGDSDRVDRMTNTVCEAVGLDLLRIESSVLRRAGHGRRIVEYVIDARAFRDAAEPAAAGRPGPGDRVDPDWPDDAPPGYRDIVGRLPDGRQGCVNDLGATARAAAVEAYVDRRVADPIIRDLHVDWRDGPSEGWAWLRAGEDRFLYERVRLWQHGFSCGVAPARLAADLAVAAIGERLRHEADRADLTDRADLALPGRADLAGELDRLLSRRADLATPYAFEHVSFDPDE
ncbi:DUF2726 domain-containing protein [Solwaraspora sp. WMMD1047]|uniref:DUF2726 domain-containing protein n=1 Tax=Solwaraspora sp. WMMD1047 TaxID=3016102 RepID=UPI002415B996|nr:DUF2726 domain-containing protein [Solwaraspora sp. WMMD1047]MDG4830130.1 DUF2726 domain-containing protein [Solwaraspora sp. WMMD1047]